jgi:hypothetical protein
LVAGGSGPSVPCLGTPIGCCMVRVLENRWQAGFGTSFVRCVASAGGLRMRLAQYHELQRLWPAAPTCSTSCHQLWPTAGACDCEQPALIGQVFAHATTSCQLLACDHKLPADVGQWLMHATAVGAYRDSMERSSNLSYGNCLDACSFRAHLQGSQWLDPCIPRAAARGWPGP